MHMHSMAGFVLPTPAQYLFLALIVKKKTKHVHLNFVVEKTQECGILVQDTRSRNSFLKKCDHLSTLPRALMQWRSTWMLPNTKPNIVKAISRMYYITDSTNIECCKKGQPEWTSTQHTAPCRMDACGWVNRHNFSLYSCVLTINIHLPALYCSPAHQEGLFNGTKSTATTDAMVWEISTWQTNKTKQNKLPSFTYRFNPWSVKFGLRNPELIFGGVTLYHG
jgi:hypothetical protein